MDNHKNRFSKPVAFNATKPTDQAILKHVGRRNFSGYVKKLILADMKACGNNTAATTESNAAPVKETAADRLARMRTQIKKPSDSPALNQSRKVSDN